VRLRKDAKLELLRQVPLFTGCTKRELSEISDNLPRLVSDDVAVLAVSCDPMFSLRAFADRDSLTFPLLSDFWPHGAVSAAYGVFDEARGSSTRSTFIIDGEGVLRWSVHKALGDARDMAEYVRVLAGLTIRSDA